MDPTLANRAVTSAMENLKSCLEKLNGAVEWQQNEVNGFWDGKQEIIGFLVSQLLAARTEVGELKKQLGQLENSNRRHCQHAFPTYKARKGESLKDPEDVFPIVVWSTIFGNLSDPTDVANCYRATKAWETDRELKRRRVEFLFKEVLPILLNSGYFKTTTNFNQCLQFRLICRSWKAGVDGVFEALPPHSLNELSECTRIPNRHRHLHPTAVGCHVNHFRKFSFSFDPSFSAGQSVFMKNFFGPSRRVASCGRPLYY